MWLSKSDQPLAFYTLSTPDNQQILRFGTASHILQTCVTEVSGEIVRLDEDRNEIALAVSETTAMMTKVDSAVEDSGVELNRDDARGIIKYSSLEAKAEMTVTIQGNATPGSEVFIDGVSQTIEVGRGGGFSVEVPLALVQKHEEKGHIPATCKKGNAEEEIEIPLPR